MSETGSKFFRRYEMFIPMIAAYSIALLFVPLALAGIFVEASPETAAQPILGDDGWED